MTSTSSGPSIPGYEELRAIGRGGFATVYRARQPEYDRTVAVKIIEFGFDDDAVRRRFKRECTASGRLTGHPNILSVLDSGFLADGHPYLTTQLCSGGSLAERLARGPLPVDAAVRIGVKIAGALQTAHQHGVVHRDIKPENILVNDYGEPVLADFGIATVTMRQATKRTQAYTPTHAPPEVLLGELADEASDIYTLGSTLYELLAGAPAFADTGHSGLALFVDHVLNSEPPPLARADAPPSLSRVLQKAMAKKRADRFATAADIGRALQDVERELGLAVTEMTAAEPKPAPQPQVPTTPPVPVSTMLGERAQRAAEPPQPQEVPDQVPLPAESECPRSQASTGGRSRHKAVALAAAGVVVALLAAFFVVRPAIGALFDGSSDGDEAGVGYSYVEPAASPTQTESGADGGVAKADEGPDRSLCPSAAELKKATGKSFRKPLAFVADAPGALGVATACGYSDDKRRRVIVFNRLGVPMDSVWEENEGGAPMVISGAAARSAGDYVAVDVGVRVIEVWATGEPEVAQVMAAVVVGRP